MYFKPKLQSVVCS